MPNEHTIDAVRLALGMYELRAHVASINIANAGTPGARAVRIDFAEAQAALDSAARTGGDEQSLAHALEGLGRATPMSTGESTNLDQQVAEMSAAGLGYQSLTEALSRQFGLMRLSIAGRS